MIDPTAAFSDEPNTITVLIGPNGSGKSRLLRDHAERLTRNGQAVIAVAPSIFDRFKRIGPEHFHFFGARQGQVAAARVIRSTLVKVAAGEPQLLKNLSRVLAYTGFDPVVGIRIPRINFARIPRTFHPALSAAQEEGLISALHKWHGRSGRGDVIEMYMNDFSFHELDSLSFALLAQHETLLRNAGIIPRIEYVLFRQDQPISLLQACSGELAFVTTMAFISTYISRRAVILIDEPETSLHPTWQKDYAETLLDLFHFYEPRIVISTHSPIIISGAGAAKDNVRVFEVKEGNLTRFQHQRLSLEEMYERLFGLLTPKNHHLSRVTVALLNDLNRGQVTLDEVRKKLRVLRDHSYDESQRVAIDKIEDLAQRMEVTNA